jgi:hypothetical protein
MDRSYRLIREAIQSDQTLNIFRYCVYLCFYSGSKQYDVIFGDECRDSTLDVKLGRFQNRSHAEAVKEKLDAILRHELRNRIVITRVNTGETFNANNIPKT